MKTQGPVVGVGWLAVLVTGFLAPCLGAAGQASLVGEAYPGLASGCLTYARLSDLAKGTLLEAGDLVITEKEVADEIAKAPPDVQAQLKKNGFFPQDELEKKLAEMGVK